MASMERYDADEDYSSDESHIRLSMNDYDDYSGPEADAPNTSDEEEEEFVPPSSDEVEGPDTDYDSDGNRIPDGDRVPDLLVDWHPGGVPVPRYMLFRGVDHCAVQTDPVVVEYVVQLSFPH